MERLCPAGIGQVFGCSLATCGCGLIDPGVHTAPHTRLWSILPARPRSAGLGELRRGGNRSPPQVCVETDDYEV